MTREAIQHDNARQTDLDVKVDLVPLQEKKM